MKVWLIALGCVLVLAAGAAVYILRPGIEGGVVTRAPSAPRGSIRIATFNVDGLAGPAAPEPSSESHLAWLAEAIERVDADVLALQDVESEESLRWFVDTYLPSSGYQHVVSIDVGHSRGAENAVLSRVAVVERAVWPQMRLGSSHPETVGGDPNPLAGQAMRFRRSPLMVELLPEQEEQTITLFIVEHKGGNRFDYWREAEARAIVALARELGMSRRIVIAGSFHAEPDAAWLDVYGQAGFKDAFAAMEADERASEVNGESTDYILTNRVASSSVEPRSALVLDGTLAPPDSETEHVPIAVNLIVSDLES